MTHLHRRRADHRGNPGSTRLRAALVAATMFVAAAGPAAAQQNCDLHTVGWWETVMPLFSNPDGPAPNEKSYCDFQLWSWSAFVHFMRTVQLDPQNPNIKGPAFLLLPGFSDLKPDGGKLTAVQAQAEVRQHPLMLIPRGDQPRTLGSFEQAGSKGVLVAQNGRSVYYTTHMDLGYFTFTQTYFGPNNYQKAEQTTNYPIGANVLKTSWRIVPQGETVTDAYTTTALVPRLYNDNGKLKTSSDPNDVETVTVALIGVHVVGVIKNHPEFIWATFELPSNAPLLPAGMDPHSSDPVSAQSYPLYKGGTPADQSNFLPDKMSIDEKTQVITPVTNVFQRFVDGGATPQADKDAITSSNANFQAGIRSHKDKIDPIFANYRLTGTTWLLAGTLTPGDGDMVDEAIGSIDLANATMETFEQDVGENCFFCHDTAGIGKNPGKNINTSHIITSQLKRNPKIEEAR